MQQQATGVCIGPSRVNQDPFTHGKGTQFIRQQACQASPVMAALAAFGDNMVEDLIKGPQPGFGSSDRAFCILFMTGVLFVLEDQKGGLVSKELKLAQGLNDPRGFAVVVFILNVEGGGSRVDDDQARLVLHNGLAHGMLPAVGQRVMLQAQHGVQMGQLGTRMPGPGPLVVLQEVGVAVFFVKVQDLGGHRGMAQKWSPGAQGIGQAVAECRFAGTGFPGQNDHGASGQHVVDNPARHNGRPREDVRGFHGSRVSEEEEPWQGL